MCASYLIYLWKKIQIREFSVQTHVVQGATVLCARKHFTFITLFNSPPWEVGPLTGPVFGWETKTQRCSQRVTMIVAELGTGPIVNTHQISTHQEVNSAQSTKEARQCLSEEWAGTSFSVNDRKHVSGSQLVMALVKFLQRKSIYSESQVSSWSIPVPAPDTAQATGNCPQEGEVNGQGSRFLSSYFKVQGILTTLASSPWINSLLLRGRALRKLG